MPNKRRTIALEVTFLHSFHEKSAGLIGKNPIRPISFSTHWGIHTFGMRQPIDVLILDKKHQVRHLVQRIQPNHFFFWNPIYSTVVELPAGWITKHTITLGDTILLHSPSRH